MYVLCNNVIIHISKLKAKSFKILQYKINFVLYSTNLAHRKKIVSK